MNVSSDFKELLRLFNRYQVKYLVVGGYAVIKYTEPRYTKDLDLWTKASAENASAVYQALLTFGAPLEGLVSMISLTRVTSTRWGLPRCG